MLDSDMAKILARTRPKRCNSVDGYHEQSLLGGGMLYESRY